MKRSGKRFKQSTQLVIWLSILLAFFYSCKTDRSPSENEFHRQVIILYTNDEHGWIEPTDTHGGAAGMMELWKQNEGYTDDGPFLILSGGDMWTGPAVSTWTKGESMTDVMNGMKYDAAAIGNHEFDFKIPALIQRVSQAEYRLLSANIREKETGEIPGFATPFIIKEVNGVRVGIIGLSSISTPLTTFPDHVKDYDFIPYRTALEEIVPRVRADGAELLVVAGHVCYSEIHALIPVLSEHGISVFGGGHCHELIAVNYDGIAFVEAGSNMTHYGKVDITFDTDTDTVIGMDISTHENIPGARDQDIQAIVLYWTDEVDKVLSEVIGYVSREIGQNSPAMHNMVTDSWLARFPPVQVSLTNSGGIRQSIPAGNITLGTIVGLLPFENNLIRVELTGDQVIDLTGNLIVGGMTTIGGYRLSDGTPLETGTVYNVITIDYLYSRPDYSFRDYDPTPIDTTVHYRQPVIDWIRSLNTSETNPLDNYLDYTARK